MTETTPAAATEQQRQQRVVGRPFKPGQSGNPRGRIGRDRLRAEHTAKLQAHHGRALSPMEQELVEQLVAVKLAKPQSASDTIKQANTISRLMHALYGRSKPEPAEPDDLQTYLARIAAEEVAER